MKQDKQNEKVRETTLELLQQVSNGIEVGVFKVCAVRVSGVVSVAIRDVVTDCYVAFLPAFPKRKEIDRIINTDEN
mgnify:CR=1 FL=1|nr:MAG TPA: hypothetical protein [Herelleviridae sp.]